MLAVKTVFTIEEISACTSREQLTELLQQAANREALISVFREYGIVYAGLEFCTKEKLAGYLAGELLMLRKVKPLRRKIGLFKRIVGVLERKSEDIALSFSGAVLAGMMVFMLVL